MAVSPKQSKHHGIGNKRRHANRTPCAGTHDHTRSDMPLVTKPVVIEPETWIAADTFIGPGVTVGRGSVVGARSSVFKDLEPWGIYAGNPARKLRDRALDESAADQSE